MRTVLSLSAVLFLSVALFAADEEPVPGLAEARAFFPGPQEVAGWAISTEIEAYPGQKIYDFIDGAGEIFMKYNFELAVTAEYKGPQDLLLSVEVYKMKTPEDAYGIFAYHRPDGAEALDVTQAGYASGITVGLWRNLYYVKIQGFEEKPGLADAVRNFARAISPKIPGEGNLPLLFTVIQVDGFLKGSARFARSNLALKNLHFVSNDDVLKLDEGALIAFGDYSLKGRNFKAFAIVYPSEAAAAAAASAYARAIRSDPENEATWFVQNGKVIAGVWTGLKVTQTQDSESMMYETIKNILAQVTTYQLNE